MITMAKKNVEDKKSKFIKILITEIEAKEIERHARNAFQSKSEFVRTAVKEKINKINKERLEELKFKSKLYKEFKEEFSKITEEEFIDDVRSVIPLKKPDVGEMKQREDEKEKRKIELDDIKKALNEKK